MRKLSNEIVKYDNQLNEVPLGRLNAVQLNFFMTLVQQSYSKGTSLLHLPFSKLKELSKYQPTANERFIKDLMSTNAKLLELNIWQRVGHKIVQFACFDKFEIDPEACEVTVSVKPEFLYLFNDLSRWTRFQLAQFTSLHSTYAKNMFRLLKQYRTVGRLRLTKEELFKQLDLPKSYLDKTSRIQQRVLSPIKEELSPVIRGLAIKTIRGAGRGRPVVAYEFTWHPEAKNADDFSKGQYADDRQKLDNIDLNPSLTPEEKAHAYDRVLGFKLGTTDHKQWQKVNTKGLSENEIAKEISQKEYEKHFRELFKTWLQFYGRANAQIVNKLRFLYDSYGLDDVCTKITYYGKIPNLGLEPLRILELIENSLTQEQGEN